MADDSLLITGPPGSGKSGIALGRFLGIRDSLFLTPSATMAEHVRNNLARGGAAIRPSRVTTFASFLAGQPGAGNAAPAPLVHRLIRQTLQRQDQRRFRAIAQYRGFHAALATLLEEAPAEIVEEDLAALLQEVERELAARGFAIRRKRLEAAAGFPFEGPSHVVLDGFFSFSPAELAFLGNIANSAVLTVTLPDWRGGAKAGEHFLRLGLIPQRLHSTHRRPSAEVFSAPTLTRETEEIARRILEEAGRGRPYREIGVILRQREPYAAALETAFGRFGIPSRSYFADPLMFQPAIRYLAGLVHAMLEGWDHATLLGLLRMPVSGTGATPEGDQFDFELRQRLPGAGLPIRGLHVIPPIVERLVKLDPWRYERLEPAEWAARAKTLRTLLPQPAPGANAGAPQVRIWRATAEALEGFDGAMDATAEALKDLGRVSLAEFWSQADLTLELEPLRGFDQRRNVVHILDVYEARQWELPVVFVCGLTERHFPQYHREDPLLRDAARRQAGLKTSAEQQTEERFLFELASTRATVKTVFSRPCFNEKGDELLASFFLEGMEAAPAQERIRPRALVPAPEAAGSSIQDAGLLGKLAQTHKSLAPTSIESYLQCPFQFFAGKTLRLKPRPPAPRDRLDVRAQGSILHRTLAEMSRMPLLGAAIFDQVFEDECARAHIPLESYRTEAVRLELLRHFLAFLADRQVTLGWPSRVEEKFSFPLNPLLTIAGRIDRLDIGARNRALVVDYKYSAGDKIREKIEEHAAGNLVQGGLYLIAAERLGLEPAGMLYCGLRKEIVWDGWHVPIEGLERIGESRTPAAMRELMQAAAARAVETFDAITSGRIAPAPADPSKCRWCDFKDMCRVESAAALRTAGGEE